MTSDETAPIANVPPLRAGAVLFARDCEALIRFYAAALGFVETERGDGYAVLDRGGFELVVHGASGGGAATKPPGRRTDVPVKLVFVVTGLDAVRSSIEQYGGSLDDPAKAWRFRGLQIIDAQDPEGNVIQLRASRR